MAKDIENRKKTEAIFFRVKPEFAENIKKRALMKNCSIASYIESLVSKELSSDTSDEALFIYQVQAAKREVLLAIDNQNRLLKKMLEHNILFLDDFKSVYVESDDDVFEKEDNHSIAPIITSISQKDFE